MSKLNIGGNVVWSDRTPAQNARVRIYDIDTGGNGNDLIFESTTNRDGQFQGLSEEWEDRNSVRTPLGIEVPVPDALLLEFRATVPDGRTHTGPYFHLGNNRSATIILPWPGHDGSVQQSQRELIHLITLSEGFEGADRSLYEVIEFAADRITTAFQSHYRGNNVRILRGPHATLDRLKQELQSAASDPGVKAVDLMISTHGLTDKVWFYPNEETGMDRVVTELRTIPEQYRRKFRALFSTACFGASHLDEWRRAGFEVASGSRAIYADGAASYPAFLTNWTGNATFEQAVNAANTAGFVSPFDEIARQKYRLQGNERYARQIDSFREVQGNKRLKITSVP